MQHVDEAQMINFNASFRSSSVVEHSAVNRAVVGSNPTCGASASIAQLVEHFHGKEEVIGSNPISGFCLIHAVMLC